jgi:hypothetical protein
MRLPRRAAYGISLLARPPVRQQLRLADCPRFKAFERYLKGVDEEKLGVARRVGWIFYPVMP